MVALANKYWPSMPAPDSSTTLIWTDCVRITRTSNAGTASPTLGSLPIQTYEIGVRIHWFTYVDEGTELSEIPADKRCTGGDEAWSFNYASGEVKKVDNSQPLLLFKKFAANPRTK